MTLKTATTIAWVVAGLFAPSLLFFIHVELWSAELSPRGREALAMLSGAAGMFMGVLAFTWRNLE